MTDDPLLTVKECAELLGIKPTTWRSYVDKGLAPDADDPDDEAPNKYCRRPRWRRSSVVAFQNGRPGKGFRSDVHGKKAAPPVAPPATFTVRMPVELMLAFEQWLAGFGLTMLDGSGPVHAVGEPGG